MLVLVPNNSPGDVWCLFWCLLNLLRMLRDERWCYCTSMDFVVEVELVAWSGTEPVLNPELSLCSEPRRRRFHRTTHRTTPDSWMQPISGMDQLVWWCVTSVDWFAYNVFLIATVIINELRSRNVEELQLMWLSKDVKNHDVGDPQSKGKSKEE